MTYRPIVDFLKNVRETERTESQLSDIRLAMESARKNAVEVNDQAKAKETWAYRQILEIQRLYLKAYSQLKEYEFYRAWCTLEQCELAINQLCPHYEIEDNDEFSICFIQIHVEKYQSIFPYKIFMSPEILEKEKKCNICGQTVSIRNPCGHEVGEIYNGEMCIRVVTDCEFLGLAIVESPLQKYSVGFLVDPETGKSKDHYNYAVVKYLIDRLISPFDAWTPHHTKVRHPHSKFLGIGRNSKCPCGSGKKYKKCCLTEVGVLMPHIEFDFAVAPPEHLQNVEYSY